MLIHIGFMRAGSSFLQGQIFNRMQLGFAQPYTRAEFQPHLLGPYALDFDPIACRAALEPGIAKAQSEGLIPVLSDEGFVGNIGVRNGYDGPEIARRLHTTFPEARILLVIREQRAHIISFYSRIIQKGGWMRVEKFINDMETCPYFDKRSLMPAKIISLYKELFGNDKILVIPFEYLVNQSNYFIDSIINFANAKPSREIGHTEKINASLSAVSVGFLRGTNRLASFLPDRAVQFYRGYLWAADKKLIHRHAGSARARLEQRIDAALGDTYAEANRCTAALTGLDLRSLGYRM